jgi:putative oxidoreductase
MMADYSQPTSWAGARDRSDWSAYTLLFGRICFAADFLLFGSRKFSNPSIIYKLIEAHHLPGALVYPTIVLQLGCGLLVLLGLQTRLAAAALGWFCIVAPSIFWLDTLEHLSRDYAAAGGFMLLVLFGPGPFSLDRRHGIRDVVVSVIPTVVSNQTLIDRVMLVARTLTAFPFLADVVKNIVHFVPQRALFEAAGLPGDSIYAVMLIELVCGLALLGGWGTRLAAIVLLVWSVVLALTIHNPHYDLSIFGGDFDSAIAKNFSNRGAATFFKDVTTVGALCVLIVYGPGALSRDAGSRSRSITFGREPQKRIAAKVGIFLLSTAGILWRYHRAISR